MTISNDAGNLDVDIKALIDKRVAEALAKQGAPVVSAEAAAANVAAVNALRNQPAIGENQALTSNPHPDAVEGVHGTAVVVSVGEPDGDEVVTPVNPVVTQDPTIVVPAAFTGTGSAPYVPITDPASGGPVTAGNATVNVDPVTGA